MRYRDADNACKDLRQKERHSAVDRALRELSSTAKGKDALYTQLDDRLKRTESAIKDFADDKSQSKRGDARGYMSEIERTIRDVDQIKGTDRKANQIASNWPDYVRAFVPTAAALQAIKEQQFNLDEAAGKCDVASRELNEKLKAYVDNNDPDGLTDGPKLATEAGEKYTRAVTAMENQRSTMRGLVSTAGSLEARDERWGPLRRQAKDTADRMYEYWDRKTQEVHKQCDELAKGTNNSTVQRYLGDLGSKTSSDIAKFQKDAKDWETKARSVYTLDCKRMQELWDAWCWVEAEANEDPEIGAVMQTTARMIDDSQKTIEGILSDLKDLKERLKVLAKKAKYRDATDEIKAEFEKQERRLERLKSKNATWRGNTNPAIQFTKTYGQQAHDRMAGQYRCNVYDQAGYPGLGKGRPDCVVVNGKGDCKVYEFKPKGWSGTDPLPDYLSAVRKYYTNMMRSDQTPESKLGGAAFQALVEANCRVDPSKDKKNDSINFDSDFRYYDRCDFQYECTE